MKIVVYGLTITSSWGNGHATTYRSLLKSLARRGHVIEFIEKDVEWYRDNRDLLNPAYCTVRLYTAWEDNAEDLVRLALDADVIIIGSYFPDAIAVTLALSAKSTGPIIFYDIDTPITLSQLRECGGTAYLDAALIPAYAAYLSFTGGPVLQELEQRFGARYAVPFFCSVDPELYHITPVHAQFACDLSYLGTYAADRQSKLMRLLNGAAARSSQQRFIVAGSQYPEQIMWANNVKRVTHVAPPDHSPFYSSCRFTLNLTREDMVAAGYSPSVRLFEASACGAAIISDQWTGLSDFLSPGEEILVATEEDVVLQILNNVSEATRVRIGKRARERVLAEHTADHRALQFEQIVSDCSSTIAASKKKNLRVKTNKDPVAPSVML